MERKIPIGKFFYMIASPGGYTVYKKCAENDIYIGIALNEKRAIALTWGK